MPQKVHKSQCPEQSLQNYTELQFEQWTPLKTLLFMGDYVIVVDSECALQIPIQKLETVTSKYGKKFQQEKQKHWLLREEI
jgi:hypothetical protein